MSKVVIVTGSRYLDNTSSVWRALEKHNPFLIVQGGCKGADLLAREWGRAQGVQVCTFHADWDSYGKAAGPIRNRAMLSAFPEATVLAFPLGESKGTRGCISIAQSLEMRVEIYA